MDKGVAELREWVQTHLPGSRSDEAFLRRFLTGCKQRQDVARSKLTHLHRLVETTPQWFQDRDPTSPALQHLLQLGVFLVLPAKDQLGRTLVVVRATINNPKTHPMELVFKAGMMVIDLALEQDESISEKGVVVIIDLDKVSISHAWQMNISLIRRAVHSWQDCYPVPVKRIHFLNCPYKVNSICNMFKKFMKKKLQDRMFLHGSNAAVLHKYIAPELLPTEYQGTGESLESCAKHWLQQTTDNRLWFLSQQTHDNTTASNSNAASTPDPGLLLAALATTDHRQQTVVPLTADPRQHNSE